MNDSTVALTSHADEKQLSAQVRAKLADAFTDAEAIATEHVDDAEQFVTGIVKGIVGAKTAGSTEWQPQPVTFDFDADLQPPDWIVDGTIERETLTVLSGDTGAAKSIVSSALVLALDAQEWLGLPTHIDRMTVIDDENPEALILARLKALGADNELRDRLTYFNRQGFRIGDRGSTDAFLRAHLEDFRPDLLVIDTLMAACDVEDQNNNAEAVRIMRFLGSLATEYECAVLLLHHERKQSKLLPSSSGQAMMGARQWAGQADAHMTLTVESELIESEPDEEGNRTLHRTFKWLPREKDRSGRSNVPHRVAVDSEKDESGRLLCMVVSDEGIIENATTEQDALALQIGAFVQREAGEQPTGAIAKGIGKDAQDSTFKRSLGIACDRGYIENTKRGRYAPGTEAVLDV